MYLIVMAMWYLNTSATATPKTYLAYIGNELSIFQINLRFAQFISIFVIEMRGCKTDKALLHSDHCHETCTRLVKLKQTCSIYDNTCTGEERWSLPSNLFSWILNRDAARPFWHTWFDFNSTSCVLILTSYRSKRQITRSGQSRNITRHRHQSSR